MISINTFHVRLVALMAAICMAAACNGDLLQNERAGPPRPHLWLDAAEIDGPSLRVPLVFDAPASILPGSFRLAVHYDTLRYRFDGLEGADSLLLAAHAQGGRVLVAGASLTGFASGRWTALRFAQRDGNTTSASGTPSFSMDLVEIGSLDGADLRRRVIVDPRRNGRQ